MRKEPNSSSEDISSNSENFLDNSPIDENPPSSGLADDHLRHTISELKIELDVAEEIKQDLENTRQKIDQLNQQIQTARNETEEAQSELDLLQMEEARVKAELEVIRSERVRVEGAIRQIRPQIDQLAQEGGRAKEELKESHRQLQTAKNARDKGKSELEKIKQALYATVALEAQIQAEIESSRVALEKDRLQTQEIQDRLKDGHKKLEAIRSEVSQAHLELQGARVEEAKIKAELIVGREGEPHESVDQRNLERDREGGTQDDEMQSSSLSLIKRIVHSDLDLIMESPEIPSKLVKKVEIEENLDDPVSASVDATANVVESVADQEKGVAQKDGDIKALSQRLGYNKIYELADAGHEIDEISYATNITKGQIKLLLRMRDLKEGA
jgi:chromosome segregation ATPase